jgi:hypothetical protein
MWYVSEPSPFWVSHALEDFTRPVDLPRADFSVCYSIPCRQDGAGRKGSRLQDVFEVVGWPALIFVVVSLACLTIYHDVTCTHSQRPRFALTLALVELLDIRIWKSEACT